MNRHILTAALALALVGARAAQAIELDLAPRDGARSGAPGSQVYWGFSLVNDSAYTLYFTSVYADGTLFGTNGNSALGTSQDEIALWNSSGLGVAPGTTFTGTAPAQALASFLIAANAPLHAPPVTGDIFLEYELDDADGNMQGYGTLTAQGSDASPFASVTVVATPAPPTAVLLAPALGLAGWRRRRARG